ncbi:MAG TPA: hypothetical protein VNA20_02645 [Frankiaceae bacterium]|nr:hypothetical protein [Frankiaceae bacterium]
MRVAGARESFERYLAENRVELGSVGALVAMVDWAGAEPAEAVEDDRLLYQWGTYDWAYSGAYQFEVNVTRQLTIEGATGDDAIWQLGLTLTVPESDATHELGEGAFWNDEVPRGSAFRELVERGPATAFFRTVPAPGVRLEYEPV